MNTTTTNTAPAIAPENARYQNINQSHVSLVGRLIKDPQPFDTKSSRTLEDGTIAVRQKITAIVAIDDTKKYDKTNPKVQEKTPCTVPVYLWTDSTKHPMLTFMHKGDLVYINGRLKSSRYQSKTTGEDIYKMEVEITSLEPLETIDVRNKRHQKYLAEAAKNAPKETAASKLEELKTARTNLVMNACNGKIAESVFNLALSKIEADIAEAEAALAKTGTAVETVEADEAAAVTAVVKNINETTAAVTAAAPAAETADVAFESEDMNDDIAQNTDLPF